MALRVGQHFDLGAKSQDGQSHCRRAMDHEVLAEQDQLAAGAVRTENLNGKF